MTDSMNPGDGTTDESGAGGKKTLLATAVPTLLLALGLTVLVAIWWRRGGARTAITELAEHGAVRLADAVVDEILGAAA